MAEEFDEADVLFPEDHRDVENEDRVQLQCGHLPQQPPRETTRLRQPACRSSAPVRIPVMARPPASMMDHGSWARRCHSDGGGVGAASFVAPHEMTARRRCASEERSVCVGQGRTLKGRDLLYLRTAVLRMTGFLET